MNSPAFGSPLVPFPFQMEALTQVTPFSYRDGMTYARMVEGLRHYLNQFIVPEFNSKMEEIITEFQAGITNAENTIDTRTAEWLLKFTETTAAWEQRFTESENGFNGRFTEFVSEITVLVESINNRVGNPEIQYLTLTADTVISINPLWPTKHFVSYVVTQDSVGGHTITFAENISGKVEAYPEPGALTIFKLSPITGAGQWTVTSDDYFDWMGPNSGAGSGAGGVSIGRGAAQHAVKYSDSPKDQGYIAIGRDALGAATRVRANMAIGAGAMAYGNPGVANIAIGTFALSNVEGVSEYFADMAGSRNIAIGSLAGHFIEGGHRNTLMGRDAGHSITTGGQNVGIGYRAVSCGYAPIGLSGAIENQFKVVANYNVGVGTSAITNIAGEGNTALGHEAGKALRAGINNVFIGRTAANNLGKNVSENGFNVNAVNLNGTYNASGGFIAVNIPNHGVVAGKNVMIKFNDGPTTAFTTEAQYLKVSTVTSVNQFMVPGNVLIEGTGTVTLTSIETDVAGVGANSVVAIGWSAMGAATKSGGNTTAVGEQAGYNSEGAQNTFVGSRSGFNMVTGNLNTMLGYNAGRSILPSGQLNNVDNVTCVGQGTAASASNQIQLGAPATAAYAYGAVQDRSDIRDKADVRDTVLGLDFINQIRPVDYRLDYRDEYENGISDGTKKRTRFHHGVIAQEIEAIIENTGIDFGGFQDHKIVEGGDVLTIGYTEFIAPLIKAVQELSDKVATLEAIIKGTD